MSGEVRATKAKIIELMLDEAAGFFTWMSEGTGNQAVETRMMWESVDAMNLLSPTIQLSLIPNLLNEGVITQATVDRLNSFIANEQKGAHVES